MKNKTTVYLCVVLFALILAGCGKKGSEIDNPTDNSTGYIDNTSYALEDDDDYSNYYSENVMMDVSLVDKMGVDSMDFEEYPGLYDGDIIPDAKTAKRYADLIWKYTLNDSSHFRYFGGVSYDSKKEIWEVWYSSSSELMCGGDVEIAISKKTGEVLRVTYGE